LDIKLAKELEIPPLTVETSLESCIIKHGEVMQAALMELEVGAWNFRYNKHSGGVVLVNRVQS
jgi:hypothetical protein